MPQLLSLSSRTWELQLLKPGLWSLCSTTREATAMKSLRTSMKSSPFLLQLEKSLSSDEDPAQPKIKKENYVLES